MCKNCTFFPLSGAESGGSGGAPPTTLILLRNQCCRIVCSASLRVRTVSGGVGRLGGGVGGPPAPLSKDPDWTGNSPPGGGTRAPVAPGPAPGPDHLRGVGGCTPLVHPLPVGLLRVARAPRSRAPVPDAAPTSVGTGASMRRSRSARGRSGPSSSQTTLRFALGPGSLVGAGRHAHALRS